jgi:hypothetical protein
MYRGANHKSVMASDFVQTPTPNSSPTSRLCSRRSVNQTTGVDENERSCPDQRSPAGQGIRFTAEALRQSRRACARINSGESRCLSVEPSVSVESFSPFAHPAADHFTAPHAT